MNTSITWDLLELIVPTAIKWDQLLPGTWKQPYEVETGYLMILVKNERCLHITLIPSYIVYHAADNFIASSVSPALHLWASYP